MDLFRKAKFTHVRDTKGAAVYAEIDGDGKIVKGDAEGQLIGSMYLRLAALEGEPTPEEFIAKIYITKPGVKAKSAGKGKPKGKGKPNKKFDDSDDMDGDE